MLIHVFKYNPRTNNKVQREIVERIASAMHDAIMRFHCKEALGAEFPELGYPDSTLGETWLCLDAGPWACRMEMYLLDEFTHANGYLTFKFFGEDFRPLPERSKEALPETNEGESYGVCGYVSLDGVGDLTVQILILEEPGEDKYPSWDPTPTDSDVQPTLAPGRGAFYSTTMRTVVG